MNTNSTLFEGYATEADLASAFNVTVRTIRNYVNLPNGLPSVVVGKKRLFNLDSVRTWLADRESQRNPTKPERRGRRRA